MSGFKGVKYSDGLWRAAVRQVQGDICQACGRRTVPGEVHHLFSRRHDMLRWDPRNGYVLCKACHGQAHDDGWTKAYREASPYYDYLQKRRAMNFKDFLVQRGMTAREFQVGWNKRNAEIIRRGR